MYMRHLRCIFRGDADAPHLSMQIIMPQILFCAVQLMFASSSSRRVTRPPPPRSTWIFIYSLHWTIYFTVLLCVYVYAKLLSSRTHALRYAYFCAVGVYNKIFSVCAINQIFYARASLHLYSNSHDSPGNNFVLMFFEAL